ncbi:rho guanine nucleotide exchange factor 18a isoform X2 [Sardina pilchardus]|uniref:rho guanine nucleotide exchange factor 18a isoform X2 n=1 Tax=Sardina pilchardus TaxID=27697 RepID=UPI002E14D623
MDEIDAIKLRLEESFISSQIEPINIEDPHYTDLRADLEADVQGFEVETWGLSVDQQYMKQLQKEAIKRQEVIYELIQTEINYVRTLKIMLGVFAREMRNVLDEGRLQRMLPPAEGLLDIHQNFLRCLKERRLQSQEPGSENNYCIQRLGDILCAQFSGEKGASMADKYGGFCSHHNDAVGYYREQVQSNKKLQYLMRKISQLTIVRRLEVPACILLVTQRITKYPVLVERIIKNTEAGTEEHEELVRALALIKGTIMQVDGLVNEYEKAQRLRDIAGRVDPKSPGRMKDGRELRREDLLRQGRRLLHEGTVNYRTTSGRLKDVLAVLLSDVLIILQEKDQKYVFSSVDNKSSVIPLQKLIVRNVALDEKAIFLICASSDVPEMYEVLTGSKEERDIWMNHIWEAIASCPEDVDEELASEQVEANAARLRDFQEHLYAKDTQIVQLLEEKLQAFAALAERDAGVEDTTAYRRLLLHGTTPDLQQGEQLLLGAIDDVVALQGLLVTGEQQDAAPDTEISPELAALPRRTQTFQGYDHLKRNDDPQAEGPPKERNQRPSSDPLVREHYPTEGMELSADEEVTTAVDPVDFPFPKAEYSEKLVALTQKLCTVQYSEKLVALAQKLCTLQAVISEHDTNAELLRATGSGERANRQRGNVLLEQERQRQLERHREAQANFQRLQSQHRQEQERWERERRQQQLLAETADAELRQRREACERQEAALAAERDELQRHRQEYQEDLERLREATRKVERQREELEQQRLKQEKAKKSNTISNPGHFSYELATQSFSHAATEDWPLIGTGKTHVRPSLSQAPSSFLEKPPEVPPRRESINPSPTKTEVPMHLISTTNQAVTKGGPIQQQIPTKLAFIKGKEKGGKEKGKSHHRTNSAASIEVSQVIPIKVTGKEGGSLKSKRSSSPRRLHPDTFVRPDKPSNVKPSHTASMHRKAGQSHSHSHSHSHSQDPQSRHRKGSGTPKEDIIFF